MKKLGVPGHEELAMGAIAGDGGQVINEYVVKNLRITREEIDRVTTREHEELERHCRLCRASRPAVNVRGLKVILVDDGGNGGDYARSDRSAKEDAA